MSDKLIRPWDENFEGVPEIEGESSKDFFEREEAYYIAVEAESTPDEFVFAVTEAGDDHWSISDSKIFVTVSPKEYWEREGYQWDQHLTGFIDAKALNMDEALESTFDYMGESVETCIAELTAYGMIHDLKFQKTVDGWNND